MNQDSNARGRPIMPIKTTTRVTVFRGKVYAAPVGYVAMGMRSDGVMIASNGDDVVEMALIGTTYEGE